MRDHPNSRRVHVEKLLNLPGREGGYGNDSMRTLGGSPRLRRESSPELGCGIIAAKHEKIMEGGDRQPVWDVDALVQAMK